MDTSESTLDSINPSQSVSEEHSVHDNDTASSIDGTSTLHNLDEFSLTPSPIPELEESPDLKETVPHNDTLVLNKQSLHESSEDIYLKPNQQSKRDSIDSTCSTTERIMPIMDVRSTIKEKLQKVPSLRRTYSEYAPFKMEKKNPAVFGSQETLSNVKSKKTPTSTLRRGSMDKSVSALKSHLPKKPLVSNVKKSEKGVSTEVKDLKKVEPRVDSIRRQIPKPRSQIVAAVTQRLYAKTKKKEIGINTENLTADKTTPKELSICSNARFNLRELTRRAMRAHRFKDDTTQTDLFPVLRVKETSTDVNDLKLSAHEVRDAETIVNKPATQDTGVSCTYLESFSELPANDFKNAFVVTRSCSTQVEKDLFDSKKDKESDESSVPTVSFTKYLRERNNQKPELLESIVSNPIFTNTVNINISHNYLNGHRNDVSTPEDSLDEQQNMNLPTPDLISNHNSLEPHNIVNQETDDSAKQLSIEKRIKYSNSHLEQIQLQTSEEFLTNIPNYLLANWISIPDYSKKLTSITIPSVYVPEICLVPNYEDRSLPFPTFRPETAKPKITEYKDFKCDDCIILREPIILKSIMKQMPVFPSYIHESENTQSDTNDESFQSAEIPDSLEYHMANAKKVRFSKGKKMKKDKMYSVMSNFFEEATTLMSNLTTAANKLDQRQSFPDDFDLEITVDDISDICSHFGDNRKKKRKKQQTRKAGRETESTQTEDICVEDDYCQTIPLLLLDSSTQYDCDIPINKYEALLEDSCKRLEEKINSSTHHQASIVHHLSDPYVDDQVQQCDSNIGYNPWDLSLLRQNDFSSLESNPVTFSDYGSLPRKYPKRHRTSSCSPSAFLRQLTNMRKQVIETTRDELLN